MIGRAVETAVCQTVRITVCVCVCEGCLTGHQVAETQGRKINCKREEIEACYRRIMWMCLRMSVTLREREYIFVCVN